MRSRGQTSLEVLLVISFTLLIGLMISIPFLSEQSRTDVAVEAKLAALPYIEKNSKPIHIANVQATVSSVLPASSSVSVTLNVVGKLDSSLTPQAVCDDICSKTDSTGYFSSVSITWNELVAGTPTLYCNTPSC